MKRFPGIYIIILICIVESLVTTCGYEAVSPFFAPPQKSGRVTVRLCPMENVAPGNSTLVTFGFPFTRSSMRKTDLNTVRILTKDNAEIQAYVDELSPWRHITDKNIDCRSVRIARIQFYYTFSASFPDCETVTIEWGLNRRGKNSEIFRDPLTAWHLVDSGTFAAEDSVFEPDVYAVLPKEYLCSGSLKLTRMLPIDSGVAENREDPGKIDAVASWPDYQEMDHAQHNFFFTLLNESDSSVSPQNLCPYKTEYEPWLYDRSTAMFTLYMRSGHLKPLREAIRHTQFYRNMLWDDNTTPSRFIGLFKLKVPLAEGFPTGNGAMYSYNQCLAYYYWLTGDEKVLEEIEWIVNAHEQNDEPTRWNPSLDFWTERHTAFRLLANTIAYEITGKESYKRFVIDQYNDFIWHQNGAGGALPADRIEGGLYHNSGRQSDITPRLFIASSWMTVLTVDAMLRVYAINEDGAIAEFIKRVGNFEKAACKFDSNHTYGGGPLWYCDYIMRHDGSSHARSGSMVEHSLEIAATVAWAAYFSSQTGKPDTSLINLADRMYDTYDAGVNHWITPVEHGIGGFAFRVSPWRKYAWEYVPSGSFSWLMTSLKHGKM